MKMIGLLDCNNFFVSCERLFRPDLRTRPTIVLSSNDGCVVARSQEIKDMGIPMGVPYFQIKDSLKDSNPAIFSSNFRLYRDVSARVFEVLRTQVSQVEQYSIDEAFFSMEAGSVADAERQAVVVKAAVEKQVGVPVSIGVSVTKTWAKYASKCAKRGSGVVVFNHEDCTIEASSISVNEVWGVGRRLTIRLKEHQIHTVADIRETDKSRIDAIFGVAGVRLQQELLGIPVFLLNNSKTEQQSIMSTRSFKKATESLAVVEDAVTYHVRSALEDLRGMDLLAAKMRVAISPSRHGDYIMRGGSMEVTLPQPSSDTLIFQREAVALVAKLFEKGVPYKKAGVVLLGLVSQNYSQGTLFAGAKEGSNNESLMQTVDSINTTFGKESIQIGSRLLGDAWSVRRERLSPAYTTRWSDLPSVTA